MTTGVRNAVRLESLRGELPDTDGETSGWILFDADWLGDGARWAIWHDVFFFLF